MNFLENSSGFNKKSGAIEIYGYNESLAPSHCDLSKDFSDEFTESISSFNSY